MGHKYQLTTKGLISDYEEAANWLQELARREAIKDKLMTEILENRHANLLWMRKEERKRIRALAKRFRQRATRMIHNG